LKPLLGPIQPRTFLQLLMPQPTTPLYSPSSKFHAFCPTPRYSDPRLDPQTATLLSFISYIVLNRVFFFLGTMPSCIATSCPSIREKCSPSRNLSTNGRTHPLQPSLTGFVHGCGCSGVLCFAYLAASTGAEGADERYGCEG
jgi:hypothetical protein